MSAQMSRIYQLGTIGVCVIASLWTLWHIAWVLRFHPGDDLWGPALVVLFLLALVLAFLRYAQDRGALITSVPGRSTPSLPSPASSSPHRGRRHCGSSCG